MHVRRTLASRLTRDRSGSVISRRFISRSWLGASGLSWLLVLLGLLGQMALGAVMPPEEPVAQAEMAALMDICHAGTDAGMAGTVPQHHHHHHHTPDCALCPLCVALTMPGFLPAPGPELPAPPVLPRRSMAALPPARAPPAYSVRAAYPRGPPVLI
jgi:hypothetical protein